MKKVWRKGDPYTLLVNWECKLVHYGKQYGIFFKKKNKQKQKKTRVII